MTVMNASALENNFALAAIVFTIGLLATLITVIFVVKAHRYWENQEPTGPGDRAMQPEPGHE